MLRFVLLGVVGVVGLGLTACCRSPRATQPSAEEAPVAAAESAPATAPAQKDPGTLQGTPQKRPWREPPQSTVMLDGEETRVAWSDGDTFRIKSGPHANTSARLHGYNTLEDYGPVHRWGGWTHQELFGLAKAAGERARSGTWTCQSAGEKDRYKRLLVRCDDAGLTLVREGLAFVFSVDGPAPEPWQAAQKEARENARGMWAKGTPSHLVSSLHSVAESKDGRAYNRIVDARTGHAEVQPHEKTYAVCEEVCVGEGPDLSCMVYVPFERRYKNRAECLQ